ncbi:(d)CMP kinase [Paenibacillus contaminans]|uniref:Cytidylate kinase n=1 Tax=Paenibacillus contaminans TaxID=450362 RepID=A0A329MH39_9BACL|nr:(d)CMP kinase [Paenibacillus contaminans]RAV18676.1 (d)CMP kinase [Paenibacillus contaminans]
MNKFNIALDGPAGAGKSTVARLVANELGFVYIDTGAMYRAVTWKVLELGILADQTAKVIETAKAMDIVLQPGPTGQQVLVDGEDVTDRIRSAAINANVSLIAQIAEVRELLVSKQKAMAASKGVVMDGRDIGTQVLPDAEVKIFLTASARERAERRYKEMDKPAITVEQLELEIARRDKLDSEREVSPLVQAQDAVLLDSSNIPLQDVVGKVLELCRAKVTGGT